MNAVAVMTLDFSACWEGSDATTGWLYLAGTLLH